MSRLCCWALVLLSAAVYTAQSKQNGGFLMVSHKFEHRMACWLDNKANALP